MSKQNNVILSAVLGLMIAAGSIGCSAQNNKPVENNSGSAATQSPQSDSIFFVDVRTPSEFAEGSVQGAVNIPLDQVASRINEFKGKKEIVVFCRSGNRSGQAKTILESNGITNVLNGGSWEDVKIRYHR